MAKHDEPLKPTPKPAHDPVSPEPPAVAGGDGGGTSRGRESSVQGHWAAKKADEPEVKPAVVHGPPHLGRATHVAGEDVPEPVADETPEGERKPTPVIPADNVAVIYGLRKEGRLYRCSIAGLGVKLIEADSPDQAKDAYCADVCHDRGAEPPPAKVGGKGKHSAETLVRPEAGPSAAPTPPPGYVAIVSAEAPFVKVAPELVRCVKLTA